MRFYIIYYIETPIAKLNLLCRSSAKLNAICRDDLYWRERLKRDFPYIKLAENPRVSYIINYRKLVKEFYRPIEYPNNSGEIKLVPPSSKISLNIVHHNFEWFSYTEYLLIPEYYIWVGEVGLFESDIEAIYSKGHLVVECKGDCDVEDMVKQGLAHSITTEEAKQKISDYVAKGYRAVQTLFFDRNMIYSLLKTGLIGKL